MKPRKTLRPRDQFLRKIWLVMEIELTMMRAKRCLFKMLKLKDCQKLILRDPFCLMLHNLFQWKRRWHLKSEKYKLQRRMKTRFQQLEVTITRITSSNPRFKTIIFKEESNSPHTMFWMVLKLIFKKLNLPSLFRKTDKNRTKWLFNNTIKSKKAPNLKTKLLLLSTSWTLENLALR